MEADGSTAIFPFRDPEQVPCMLSMDQGTVISGDLSMWAPVQLERCDPCPAPTVPTYGYPLR